MDGLDLVAKERYKQKLESVGLQVSDDPYLEANSHRFRDDMSLWPRIEYGHIFGYFIKRPGTYTQQARSQGGFGGFERTPPQGEKVQLCGSTVKVPATL